MLGLHPDQERIIDEVLGSQEPDISRYLLHEPSSIRTEVEDDPVLVKVCIFQHQTRLCLIVVVNVVIITVHFPVGPALLLIFLRILTATGETTLHIKLLCDSAKNSSRKEIFLT